MGDLLRNLMPLSSRIPFVFWRILSRRDPITVRFYSGDTIAIRGPGTLDIGVAYEIFVSKIYCPPRAISPDAVRCAVDVGANVGYSLVYLARYFSKAEFIAFEPHPDNARQAALNIESNHLQNRIILKIAAAGVRAGTGLLTDFSASSLVIAEGETAIPGTGAKGVLPVEITDFFETVGRMKIDFLKIDCEGGEYDLILDPRFDNLGTRFLVLEWHQTNQHPHAEVEIMKRLSDRGWDLIPTVEHRRYQPETGFRVTGILWGFRR